MISKEDKPFHGTECADFNGLKFLDVWLTSYSGFENLRSTKYRTVLKYKGSRDGFMAKDFHSKVDGLTPNLSLIKLKNGTSIAAYTLAKWQSTNLSKSGPDKHAFLVNLTTRALFLPCKLPQLATSSQNGFGPTFGSHELIIVEPFNGERLVESCTNQECYNIPKSLGPK
jgi:hypothetical protein